MVGYYIILQAWICSSLLFSSSMVCLHAALWNAFCDVRLRLKVKYPCKCHLIIIYCTRIDGMMKHNWPVLNRQHVSSAWIIYIYGFLPLLKWHLFWHSSLDVYLMPCDQDAKLTFVFVIVQILPGAKQKTIFGWGVGGLVNAAHLPSTCIFYQHLAGDWYLFWASDCL